MDTTAEGLETHDDLFLIRELGVSQVQGYIFGKPMPAEEAREMANSTRVEAEGYQCIREPRQRLMRRAIAAINGETTEIRLRNISAMGALVECDQSLTPGQQLTIDIVGVGPVIEDGFFYDVSIGRPLTPEDLADIEKKMRQKVSQGLSFDRSEIPTDEAIATFGDMHQDFKVELLRDLKTRGTTSMKLQMLECATATPFGRPLEPDV